MLEAPEIVTIGDTQYKVEGFTKEITDAYERFMEHKFLELIRNNQDVLKEEYHPMLKRHFFDVSKGEYKFNTPNFYLFVNIDENLIELLHWCFSKHQPVSKQIIRDWRENEPELAAELFHKLMKATKKN